MTYTEGVATIEQFKDRYSKNYALIRDKDDKFSICGLQYLLANYDVLKSKVVFTTHSNINNKLHDDKKRAFSKTNI
jgi:hypothetical protein